MEHVLYILRSEVRESYYVGLTNDLERRLYFHNHGRQGHTRRYRPWNVVYQHSFDSREEAQEAEQKIKSWKSKVMLRRLIHGEIVLTDYL
ncbi:MAG: GIY-YIG nuclease family protein [Balneolaceae bacterium]|nr:GIY-YIG nuclease family protein [Balneolaceae bacterium]